MSIIHCNKLVNHLIRVDYLPNEIRVVIVASSWAGADGGERRGPA